MDQRTVAILGAGSWGSALAALLGAKGHTVRLWDRDTELMGVIGERGLNPKYLPDVALPETVTATGTPIPVWATLHVSTSGSEDPGVQADTAGDARRAMVKNAARKMLRIGGSLEP